MPRTEVVMLSWEFPPRIVGGIAPHVYDLSRALADVGIGAHVVTCDFPGTPSREEVDGVKVYRFDSYAYPTPDFGTWVYLMNLNMQREATRVIRSLDEGGRVIHAHDWLAAKAGIGLKHLFRIPLVATIHATEYGRRNGLPSDYNRMIHQTELWLTREGWRIICCSKYMAGHVGWVFGTPKEKIDVVPNGIDASRFDFPLNVDEFRSRFALPSEKIVLFVGRLVWEKGVRTLLDSAPTVLKKVNAKFVVVGDGYMREEITHRAGDYGIAHKVLVTGFLDDTTLRSLYRVADVCVVPSLYEPFGIVALEAMAARRPVVASDVGGLSENVEHDVTGVKVYPNNPESLAWGICRVLLDDAYARRLSDAAYEKVLSKYSWRSIASATQAVYQRVLYEYSVGTWKPA